MRHNWLKSNKKRIVNITGFLFLVFSTVSFVFFSCFSFLSSSAKPGYFSTGSLQFSSSIGNENISSLVSSPVFFEGTSADLAQRGIKHQDESSINETEIENGMTFSFSSLNKYASLSIKFSDFDSSIVNEVLFSLLDQGVTLITAKYPDYSSSLKTTANDEKNVYLNFSKAPFLSFFLCSILFSPLLLALDFHHKTRAVKWTGHSISTDSSLESCSKRKNRNFCNREGY